MADPTLVTAASKQIIALRRDQTLLADEGVTVDRIDAYEAEVKKLDALPSDTVDAQTQAAETAEKEKAVDALQAAIRKVAGSVADAYGQSSPQYKRLNVLDLEGKDDDELLRAATDCHSVGTTFLTDEACAKEGLSKARLDALPQARQALVDLLGTRDNLVMQRSLNAQARVRQHNVVHKEYAVFNEKGQRIFKEDPARYDDYVAEEGGDAPAPVVP